MTLIYLGQPLGTTVSQRGGGRSAKQRAPVSETVSNLKSPKKGGGIAWTQNIWDEWESCKLRRDVGRGQITSGLQVMEEFRLQFQF